MFQKQIFAHLIKLFISWVLGKTLINMRQETAKSSSALQNNQALVADEKKKKDQREALTRKTPGKAHSQSTLSFAQKSENKRLGRNKGKPSLSFSLAYGNPCVGIP